MFDVIVGATMFATCAVALALVYRVAHARGYARLAWELKTDHQGMGRTALEELAQRHGARLEFYEPLGAATGIGEIADAELIGSEEVTPARKKKR